MAKNEFATHTLCERCRPPLGAARRRLLCSGRGSQSGPGRMGRSMKFRYVAAGAALSVGVIAAAGSGGTSVSNAPVTTAAGGGSSATTAAGSSGTTATTSAVAHTGSTIAVAGNNSKANVTLNQVIDPATGADSFSTPDNGKRFVGIKMTIQNTGSSTLNDDANITVSVIGSDNQSYTPDFNSIAECTNYDNGSYTLAANESVTGCTTFQLPTGITVTRVKYEPTSLGGTSGEWLNP